LEQGAKVQSSPLNVAPLVPNVEPLLHAPPRPSGFNNDHLASDGPSIGGRIFRTLARFFIAVLIGVGATLAWQSHGDDAKQIVRTWAPSLGWLLPVSTTTSPSDGPVSAQDAALPQSAPVTQRPAPASAVELVQQLEPITRDLTVVRRSLEQLAAKQEQMAQNIATLQAVEQDTRQKMSSPPQSGAVPPHKNAPMLAPPQPQPPARVSILTDWSIRDARDGYLTVQGHGDVYQVVIDAPLPGIGPVEQIKRQGGRWVVVTPKGIIVSMRDRRYFEQRTAP
jgi:hypothetical protein